MFCAHCGSSVGDGARFCSACGKPAGAPQSVAASGPAVFCQIEKYANQGAFTGWTIYFYADAVGPNGKYRAGESKHFRSFLTLGLEDGMQKIHTDFVARLTADGWIPDGNRGVHWWQIRFRKG